MYKISKLLQYPKLFHAFSTKEDGNMANVILGNKMSLDEVFKNRKKFLTKVKIPIKSCVCMWVLGEDSVKEADSQLAGVSLRDYKKAVKIDALVTNKKELYLFLFIADCAPVILYDPVRETIGLVHVGWKGADLEIVKKVINKLKDLYKTKTKDLIVGIGPAARKDSFIKESPGQINDPKWKPFLEKVNEGYKVDFIGLCKRQLLDTGVQRKNIYDCYIDTVHDNKFFSHYRDKNKDLKFQGRFACVVGLKNHY